MFTLNHCVDYVNQIYLETYKKPLSDLKRTILEGAWRGESYQQIADRVSYSKDYINRDVAYELWNELSEAIGIKISKSSFKSSLYDQWRQSQSTPSAYAFSLAPLECTAPYIHRPLLEQQCLSVLTQAGALLRLKAPQKMGKTLLLEYCLHQMRSQGIHTLKIDLSMAEQAILGDLKSFLQWICVTATEELNLSDQLALHWKDRFGLNMNFVRYFERYILQSISSPMILAIDNFDELFSEPNTFQEFSKVLRGIHENAKRSDRVGQIFQRLRLVVVHSTQAYPDIDVNHSPFNVGMTVDIPPFSIEQVQQLGQSTLSWSTEDYQMLMDYLGGQPDLIQTAIHWVQSENLNIEQLIEKCDRETSPFRTDLHRMWEVLQHNPPLRSAFESVLTGNPDMMVPSELQFKLLSMGLITPNADTFQVSCGLYRSYFTKQLKYHA